MHRQTGEPDIAMKRQIIPTSILLLSILLLSLLPLASCQRDSTPAGKYTAADPSGKTPMVLVLKPDGKGSWMVDHEDVSFTWEASGGEIRLHWKQGGVTGGKVGKDNSIDISVPEAGEFHFEKTDG